MVLQNMTYWGIENKYIHANRTVTGAMGKKGEKCNEGRGKKCLNWIEIAGNISQKKECLNFILPKPSDLVGSGQDEGFPL